MTPARKKALQWFADNLDVKLIPATGPTRTMIRRMMRERELELISNGDFRLMSYRLTDLGRRRLNGGDA